MRDQKIVVLLTESERVALELEAEKQGVGMSDLVRMSLHGVIGSTRNHKFARLRRACWRNPWLAEKYNLPYGGPRKRKE